MGQAAFSPGKLGKRGYTLSGCGLFCILGDLRTHLARISHKLSATSANCPQPLDVLALRASPYVNTPAVLVATCTEIFRTLDALATKFCEKCGLAYFRVKIEGESKMESISLEQFDQDLQHFDKCVAVAGGIDPFCSLSDWGLSAHVALMPTRRPWLFRDESGYITMMAKEYRNYRYIEPLEASWGLGCPIVGNDARAISESFSRLLPGRTDWDIVILTGLIIGADLLSLLRAQLEQIYSIGDGPQLTRCMASLHGGLSGFLGRRSTNFRRNLNKALQLAADAKISFVRCYGGTVPAAMSVFDRIIDIEKRSWKGRQGVGIQAGPMCDFYREMLRRLVLRGANRVLFAQCNGKDVAYVLGGVSGDRYRGLQFSFDADYAKYSLGNLCQYEQIRDLCDEGIEIYDLGTYMDYKSQWAEATLSSASLVVFRNGENG